MHFLVSLYCFQNYYILISTKNVLSLVIMKIHEKLRLGRPGIPCTAGPQPQGRPQAPAVCRPPASPGPWPPPDLAPLGLPEALLHASLGQLVSQCGGTCPAKSHLSPPYTRLPRQDPLLRASKQPAVPTLPTPSPLEARSLPETSPDESGPGCGPRTMLSAVLNPSPPGETWSLTSGSSGSG